MRLILRILARPESQQAFARDPAIAAACKLHPIAFELGADAAIFPRLVEVAAAAAGMWITPYVSCTAAEIAGAARLQLEARGKLVRETAAEAVFNLNALSALPLLRARPETAIRLPEGLALRRIKLAPGRIGGATDWLPEWVISDEVAAVFRRVGLSGWELKPFLDRKLGLAVAGYAQLYTKQLMPPASIDRTTPASGPPEGGWRQRGCLTYSANDLAAVSGDFARTAENWDSNRVPVWIVSSRVRQCCEEYRLKGWAWRPVLEEGSALHEEHVRLWDGFLASVAGHANIRH